MSPPVTKSWSLEELHAVAMAFMQNEYGRVSKDDQEARDQWHERLGLLVIFTHFLWESPHNGNGDANA